jgi:hypothetical protein
MPKYQVKTYKTPPGSTSPSTDTRTVEAESEYMAGEKVKAEIQRLNPKHTVSLGSIKKIG